MNPMRKVLREYALRYQQLELEALPVEPEEEFNGQTKSQYPEGIVALSAGPEFDQKADDLMKDLLR